MNHQYLSSQVNMNHRRHEYRRVAHHEEQPLLWEPRRHAFASITVQQYNQRT